MVSDVKELKIRAIKELNLVQNLKELDKVFRTFLGRKGELTSILRSLSKLSPKERAQIGKEANQLRDELNEIVEEKKKSFQLESSDKKEVFDITAPGKKISRGHLHPLTLIQREVQEIFSSMGFDVAQGPEIEDEWHNFDALNIPANHPSRDLWDTFWIKDSSTKKRVLRTHTSPVQIRYMKANNPPLRVIVPGRIFRYEATDASHQFNFYQLEGLMLGKNVSIANFRAVIQEFYTKLFRTSVTIRLRPSYFPFTEPSFEVDMSCVLCDGKGCRSCSNSGWLEMMGAGIVHPKVLKAVGYNPKEVQGFAFGMGLDRLAMMKYKVDDIRLFYPGNIKFLKQF